MKEPEYQDPETACIECGTSMIGRCGCCGAALCSRHIETQAGFCSNFEQVILSAGRKIKVTDSVKKLSRAKIEIKEQVELNGCLYETKDPTELDLFFSMEKLPDKEDKPISELDKAAYEVLDQ